MSKKKKTTHGATPRKPTLPRQSILIALLALGMCSRGCTYVTGHGNVIVTTGSTPAKS